MAFSHKIFLPLLAVLFVTVVCGVPTRRPYLDIEVESFSPGFIRGIRSADALTLEKETAELLSENAAAEAEDEKKDNVQRYKRYAEEKLEQLNTEEVKTPEKKTAEVLTAEPTELHENDAAKEKQTVHKLEKQA